MSGYSGYAMSNNAVAAYCDGLVPASRTGVPAHLVEQFVEFVEWHHTSSRYNKTKFYSREEVRIAFGLKAPTADFEVNPDAVAALAQWKSKGETVLDNCHVEWLEWSGTRRHPHATKCDVRGVTVRVKGNTARFMVPAKKFNGEDYSYEVTKRLTTGGFFIWREGKQFNA